MKQYWKMWGIGPWETHSFTPESIWNFIVRGKPIEEDFKNIIAATWGGDIQVELCSTSKKVPVFIENF